MGTLPKRLLHATILAALVISAAIYFNQAAERGEYEEAVKMLFQRVKADVETLRNLTAPKPVDLKVVDIEFFKRVGSEDLDELEAAREALYKSLLLAPPNFSIKEYKKERAGLVVAAASAHTLYVVKEYFNPYSEEAPRILAHEYTHILQYSRVKQPKFLTTDSQLAWTAFIEGEADLVAELYTSNKTGRLSLTLTMPEPPTSSVDTWFIDKLTLFPYIFGARFAYALYVAEGWRALDHAHQNPPTSTAEILYIHRYFNGSKPTHPYNPPPPSSGWRIYYPDVLGPYFFNLFLTRTVGLKEALDITSRWVGDNSTLYLSGEDQLLYWQISLSTEEQAKTLKHMLLHNLLRESTSGDERILKVEGRYLALLTKGTNLLILSASNRMLAEEALKDLPYRGFS